jgi:hypothetical protein
VLRSGLIYRDGRIVNTDKCKVMFPDWEFQYANSSAVFAKKALCHGMLIARLTGISFFGAAVIAVICPKLFPGLNPCCPP